jgi:hypothetical protein
MTMSFPSIPPAPRHTFGSVAAAVASFVLTLYALLSRAGAEPPWERKLPFEEAVITYTIEGAETGTEILSIREHGLYQASRHRSSSTTPGDSMETDTLEIKTPNWIYTYDLISGTGEKTVNPTRFLIQGYRELTPEEQARVDRNADRYGPFLPEGSGETTRMHAAEILGYSCDRTETMDTTVHTLHGTDLVLKAQGSVMGKAYSMTATAIDFTKVPEEAFRHPRTITPELVKESESAAREMAGQVLELLKGDMGGGDQGEEVSEYSEKAR